MRVKTLILAALLVVSFAVSGCVKFKSPAQALSDTGTPQSQSAGASDTSQAKVDFNTQVRPLLEARCTPCHFAGGKMYERLPFDRSETIKKLGTKLFTRIKDENEQRLIREFLAQ